MAVPSLRIQQGIEVQGLGLTFSSSEANKLSTVSVGFELRKALAAGVDEPPPTMAEVVVLVPQDFEQRVKRPSHLEWQADQLPLASSGNKINNEDPRRLRLSLDPSKTATLPVAKYRWSFPVYVPARMPAYNVFVMTICSPRTAAKNVTCGDPTGPRTLVNFPMPGFNHGQQGTGDDMAASSTGFSRRQAGLGSSSAMAFLVVAWRYQAYAS